MPAAEACFGVAGALAAAAALVAGAGKQYRLMRVARAGIGAGLVSRGVMGVTIRTALLVPGRLLVTSKTSTAGSTARSA